VALAVLQKLISRGEVGARDRVAVISTAHGLKFTEFKIRYHERKIEGMEARYANSPIELPDDVGAVQEAIEKKLDSISVT
jgi:threonine synthase